MPFAKDGSTIGIYPYAISKSLIKRAFASNSEVDLKIVSTLEEADIIFALKSYAQPDAQIFSIAASKKIPIKIIEENSLADITIGLEEVINDIPYVEKDWTNVSLPGLDKSDIHGEFPRQELRLN